MRNRIISMLPAVALSLVLIVPAGHAAVKDVTVSSYVFTPGLLKTAVPTDTIKWTWSVGYHSVTGYAGQVFDSGVQPNAGYTYQQTYNGGNLYYRCVPHGFLVGLGVPPSICSGMCGVVTDKTNVAATPVITEPIDGSSDSDGYVDVKGTGEVGTKVNIYNGATAIPDAAALVKSDGTFHIQIPFYTTGVRTLKAQARQPDLAIPASAFSTAVTVNVTGAAADVINPYNYFQLDSPNGTYIYTGTPTIKGYATDNVGVTQAAFTLVPTHGLFPSTTYTAACARCATAQTLVYWSGKPNQLERGEYRVYATVKDAAGNSGFVGPVIIYILGVTP